jgi:hypothetical protein
MRRQVVALEEHVWWLVTWTTYASSLPGDPRGFRMWRGREYIPPPKRYAKPGEPTYHPAPYRERHAMYKAATGTPVRLTTAEQVLLLPAIVAEIDAIPLVAAIISIDAQHVHLFAQFGTMPIRRIVGRLKAAATRIWHEQGGDSSRLWSRNCDMKSKPTRELFTSAFRYVDAHRGHGAIVYKWDGVSF